MKVFSYEIQQDGKVVGAFEVDERQMHFLFSEGFGRLTQLLLFIDEERMVESQIEAAVDSDGRPFLHRVDLRGQVAEQRLDPSKPLVYVQTETWEEGPPFLYSEPEAEIQDAPRGLRQPIPQEERDALLDLIECGFTMKEASEWLEVSYQVARRIVDAGKRRR